MTRSSLNNKGIIFVHAHGRVAFTGPGMGGYKQRPTLVGDERRSGQQCQWRALR